jgi:xylulokinase
VTSRPVVLGVDVGTSSTEGVLVDPDNGTILGQAGYDELSPLYRDLYPATADVVHALARRQDPPTPEETQ